MLRLPFDAWGLGGCCTAKQPNGRLARYEAFPVSPGAQGQQMCLCAHPGLQRHGKPTGSTLLATAWGCAVGALQVMGVTRLFVQTTSCAVGALQVMGFTRLYVQATRGLQGKMMDSREV